MGLEVKGTGWKRELGENEGEKLEKLLGVVGGLKVKSSRNVLAKYFFSSIFISLPLSHFSSTNRKGNEIGIIVEELLWLCGDVMGDLMGDQLTGHDIQHLTVASPLRFLSSPLSFASLSSPPQYYRRYTDLRLHHMIHQKFQNAPQESFLSSSSLPVSQPPSPQLWEEGIKKTMVLNDIFSAYDRSSFLFF